MATYPRNWYISEPNYYRTANGVVQTKPYVPAGFNSQERRLGGNLSKVYSASGTPALNSDVSSLWSSMERTSRERCLAKFKAKCYDSANAALLIAERKEAVSLMVNRLITMRRAYQDLRKGRFRDALHRLHVKPLPKHKRTRWTKPKQASALWLEYWFGWAPMVADVHTSVDILQSDIPTPFRVKVSSGLSQKYAKSVPSGSTYSDSRLVVSSRVFMQANVEVTNPNLFRANQLGLVNPATVIWELIPFSFLVDWFVNVGDFLSSYTDWLGLAIKDPMTSILSKSKGTHTFIGWTGTFKGPVEASKFSRALSIDRSVRLSGGMLTGISVTRAATAISLLVSIFTKG